MDETTAAALANGLAALSATSPLLFLAAGAERLMAIGLHIALSVLVFAGVRKKKPGYVLLAIALHAAVDAVSVLLAQKVGVAAVEICVFLMTAGVAAIALRVYRAMQAEDLTEAAPNAEASVRA